MEQENTNPQKENKKSRLSLRQVPDVEGLFVGTKSDGKPYLVRKDRNKYFFPKQWEDFLNQIPEKNKMLFDTALQTGGRIQEILNLKPSDFIWDNNSVTLRVTKSKAKKGETKILGGKRRSFGVSSQYIRRLRKYIKDYEIKDYEFLFKISKQGASQLMKRCLKKAGLPAWEFSLHNIRKTTGMWLKTVQRRGRDLDADEICMRLGHDRDTFLKHYASPSVFTDQHRDKIVDILGDMYGLK
jgi:integrase